MLKFRNAWLASLALTIGCMHPAGASSKIANAANTTGGSTGNTLELAVVGDLLNGAALQKKISELRAVNYYVSSIASGSAGSVGGAQAFTVSMTPTSDSYLSCSIKVRVDSTASGAEKVRVESTDCPKPA